MKPILLALFFSGVTVTLMWNDADGITGVEGSTNLVSWYAVVTNIVATNRNVSITISNRPQCEFYRVFNRER